MGRDGLVRAYRIAGALLILSALVHVIDVKAHDGGFSVANFFSYFTVLSNLVALVVLAIGAFRLGGPASEDWELVRGAAVLYMGMTGIIYALLLSGVDVDTPGYSNWVLHRIAPAVVVLDWLYQPPRVPLAFRRTLVWLAFPLLYLPYTLIRGEIVDWYPYPFVDPTRDGGYLRVAANSLGIAVGFVAATWLITWAGNRMAAGARRTTTFPAERLA